MDDLRLEGLLRRVNEYRPWYRDEKATDLVGVLELMLERIEKIEERLRSLPDD